MIPNLRKGAQRRGKTDTKIRREMDRCRARRRRAPSIPAYSPIVDEPAQRRQCENPARYSTVMLKEKSRVSPGAMTVMSRLCSNTSSSLVRVA